MVTRLLKKQNSNLPHTEDGRAMHYATFNARALATLIDLILSVIIILPILSIIEGLFPQAAINYSEIKSAEDVIKMSGGIFDYVFFISVYQIIQMVIFGLVIISFWNRTGATPGKMLFSIKIVDAKTFGATTQKQNFIRFIGYIISFIPLMMGFLWIVFDKRKQSWHDKMADTVVVILGKPVKQSKKK
jgi:uncharacterized RDD family membrane protein YckC